VRSRPRVALELIRDVQVLLAVNYPGRVIAAGIKPVGGLLTTRPIRG